MEAAFLDRFGRSLEGRGPDGSRHWTEGCVGLCHAAFVTDPVRDGKPQPALLGPGLALVGDIRLDAREDLIATLRAPAGSSDAELVLLAYRAWGRNCVKYLLGDFAFAVWDAREGAVFCVRDAMGVKSFLYSLTAESFTFGNVFGAVMPPAGTRLDDTWAADFLVFGHALDASASAYAEVRRLPPAHWAAISAKDVRLERYWTLPVGRTLRHRTEGEALDHYRSLLRSAVADRCGNAVALQMGGGLDSSVLAATLVGRFGGLPRDVQGHCVSWRRVFDDAESGHAGAVADALGFHCAIHERRTSQPPTGVAPAPEPVGSLYAELERDDLDVAARFTRVVLNGQGGDELFMREILLAELRRTGDPRLLVDALGSWRAGWRPALGIRQLVREVLRLPARTPEPFRVPGWLDPGWCRRLGLADRVDDANRQMLERPELPRATARVAMGMASLWQVQLEDHSRDARGRRIDVRWPYLDRRLMEFALALSPFPWCVDKFMQRRVLAGIVPERITRRPKSPLARDPLLVCLDGSEDRAALLRQIPARVPGMILRDAWIDELKAGQSIDAAHAAARALSFSSWYPWDMI